MLYSVQFLRALAAILVLISHVNHKAEQISGVGSDWFSIGGSGVDLFFIISGFIMCYATENKNIKPVGFFKARLLRVLPLYWVLTLLAFFVFLIRPEFVNSSGGTTTILHSFTLIPVGEKLLIQNGWTLSYEFVFYILFAASLVVPAKKLVITSFVIFVFVILGLLNKFEMPTLSFVTQPILSEFVMGIFSFWCLRSFPPNKRVCFFLLLVGVGILAFVNVYGVFVHRTLSYGVPFMMIFIGVVGLESLIARRSSSVVSKILKVAGDSSYSLYLIHPFALAGTAILLKKINLQSNLLFVYFMLFSLACMSGVLCYRYLEVPLGKVLSVKKTVSAARLGGGLLKD